MAERMTNLESAREWMHFSEMDFNSASFLMNMQPIPTEIICYHCQQSAEKSLKAILILNDIFPPKIHDLQELKTLCLPYITEAQNIEDACNHLNQYSVRPRYPQEIEITGEQLKKAIADAKIIYDFAGAYFPKKTAEDAE
jgi:HEPN domain-containing protein